MADTKVGIPKATVILREDHKRVKKLFKAYEDIKDGSDEEKTRLFSEIQRELTIHAAIEEEIFYPAVEAVEKGSEIVAEAREEHKVVRTLLEELAGLDPSFEAYDAKMKVLSENVEHHAEEEEDEMFPLFDELEKDEREIVSDNLVDRKNELSREAPETPDE